MKKVLFLIAFLVNAVLAMAQFPGSGTGTKDDPYLILNSDQLYSVRNFLGKENVYFSILNDIDVSDYAYGSGWEPIGSSSSSAFKGKINGNGHKITGLLINKPTKDYVGLFGYIYDARIENLSIEGNISGMNYVSGIAGYTYNSATFVNVHFKGTIHGNNNVGGITNHEGTIRNSSFTGTIIGNNYVGGITGYSAQVSNSFVDAKISANQYIGGIAGSNGNEYIDDCCVFVEISATAGYVGGIVGRSGYVNRCSVNGSIVAAGNYVGGIVGDNQSCRNSYFSGYLQGHDYVGGISGDASTSTTGEKVFYNYVRGTIVGHDFVGGIIGASNYYSNIESNISACTLIESETENVGRIQAKGDNNKPAKTCYALYNTKIFATGLPVNENTIENNTSLHGTNISEKNLKMSTFYQGLSWDFGTTWNIIDTECFPYLQTQTAPPVIQSSLACGETTISGNSVDGGTVRIIIGGKEYTAATVNNKWRVTVPALQAGTKVIARASVEDLFPSYNIEKYVSYQGNGTEDDPYLVNTCSDLKNIHGDGFYKLTSDIDLAEASSDGWQPLGVYNEAISHLDGGNHKITNLYISQEEDKVGLFANLTDATIKNLTIETAQDRIIQGKDMIGVLAGRLNNCTIENVTIKGEVMGNSYVGGLAGQINGGSLENVSVISTSVTGKNLVGGIAGTSSATINLCKFEGDVTDNVVANDGIKSGTIVYVGGIAAKSEGTITQTYSGGSVTATRVGAKAGGLVGDNYAAITNSYSTADVNGDTYAAGIAADNHAKVEKCYASGNITATNSSAKTFSSGIVGYNDGETAVVSQCAAMNKYVISTSDVGNVFRVIGGIKNSAPIPGNTNYAMENMILSVNGIRKIQGDDVFNGYMRADEMFKTQSLFENNGWDFSDVWKISENTSYPMLQKLSAEPNTSIDILVNSISISKASAILTVGETLEISATITPDDAANKSVVWSSSNNNVANVSDNGVVTAIAEGTATITATAADGSGVTGTCEITVKAAQGGNEESELADNYLTAQDITVLCGKQIDFAIGMENKAAVSSVMFDITLPEGITVESDEFGYFYEFNPDRIVSRKPHAFEGEPQSDGSIRFMSYSSSGLAHVGNTGDLVYLPINVSEDMEAGTYEIKLSNIKLAVSASEAYTCPDIVAKVTVNRYTLGDVNNDGGIDNQDVVGTVELALNRPTTAIREAADINNDGAIDNQDVVGVVSLALNRPLFAPTQTKLKAQAAEDPVNVLKVESIYADKNSEEAILAVSLENQTQFTSVMLDLYLPEGVSVLEDEYGLYLDLNNSRCNGSRGGFTVDGEKQEDGAVRIMLYSSKGTMITGNSGDLFYITLKTTGDIAAGNHKFEVKRIICAKDATAAGRFEMPNDNGYIRVKGVEPISLVVPEGGYATICLPYEATLPTGLKAYKATGIKDGMVVLEEQGNIAACTPLIIQGTAGTYNFSGDNSGADEFEYSVGSLKSSLIPAECNQGYVLQNLSKGLGFYKIKDALTVPAFRTVLEGDAVNFAPAFVPVGFDEDATAISSVETAVKNGSAIYTLDGKRVKTMEKGKIYIVGGVKMMVK